MEQSIWPYSFPSVKTTLVKSQFYPNVIKPNFFITELGRTKVCPNYENFKINEKRISVTLASKLE